MLQIKIIDGKQFKILWYFNDNKVYHVGLKFNKMIIKAIEKHFWYLVMTRGIKLNLHAYESVLYTPCHH